MIKVITPDRNKIWKNHFGTCKCSVNCGHGGGSHSYISGYREVLNRFRPERVLEWGPGPNTKMALEVGAKVLSIEPEQKWIPKDIESENWEYRIIEIQESGFTEIPDDPSNWDLFFVDSRLRQKCLVNAFKYGNPKAVICLHDAQRERYHGSLRLFSYVRFLSKGFCVASEDSRILDQLDHCESKE